MLNTINSSTVDKVAVFLDVENLSGWLKSDGGEVLLQRASELGRVVVRRAYGDFSNSSVGSRQAELSLLGFEFVHVYHSVKGKNSADIQIVVDVMEYCARITDLEWFVLATGDSDFSPLFRRLRELGKSVVGVGPRSALSEAVKRSCNRFIYIDEKSTTNGASNTTKTAQLRDDALDLLEQVLDKFPDGLTISMLKTQMLELDAAFDEKDLGFNGFLKFLQSVPESVELYQVQKTWHARAVTTAQKSGSSKTNSTKTANLTNEPTTELYRRLLRKKGWRSVESVFLWEALVGLNKRFPNGFTRNEEFEYLVETFGSTKTRAELRTTLYILCKAEYVVPNQQERSGEPIFVVQSLGSERSLSKKLDNLFFSRLVQLCKAQEVPFVPNLVRPLLINSYTTEQFQTLINQCSSVS